MPTPQPRPLSRECGKNMAGARHVAPPEPTRHSTPQISPSLPTSGKRTVGRLQILLRVRAWRIVLDFGRRTDELQTSATMVQNLDHVPLIKGSIISVPM